MKIKSVEIVGLNNSQQKILLEFHRDLNILTGRNGAGKTNILKLIWYIISGQIHQALNEINFNIINISTDNYQCKVTKLNSNTCQIVWTDEKGTETFEDIELEDEENGFIGIRYAEDIPSRRLRRIGFSVFFPTFRRIEGGFSTESKNEFRRFSAPMLTASLGEALSDLSETLSSNNHIFVASLGTKDIESLLIRKYSELSEQYNKIQKEVSNDAIEKIKEAREGRGQQQVTKYSADQILKNIQEKIESMEDSRKEIMKPLDIFKDSVLNFLKYHSGIKMGGKNSPLNFGDAATAINSNLLSAGEKQILSFLAYNTFYKNAIFIIDEPELSLHVDWQRTLFSTLMKQETSNQFIVATHSPFIYSKYPDKEIQLIEDRGYCLITGEIENE